jgi:hypothetical protein
MKPTTYVIAYISFFDNELKQTVVTSNDSKLEVAKQFLVDTRGWGMPESSTFEELQDECFNCDSAISVIEVG